MVLRECIRHEPLAKKILESVHFWKFFTYVDLSTFDVASDAFATFKVWLFCLIYTDSYYYFRIYLQDINKWWQISSKVTMMR